jgi:AraC family transcriptional regulator
VLEIHETGKTNAAGFGWYNDLPTGIERLLHRSDPLRRSISWFVHRLPRQTETVTDYSRDPVVSLEIGSFGAIERRIDNRRETARLAGDTLTLTPAMTPCEWRWSGQPFDILDVYIPLELLQSAWSEHFSKDPAQLNLAPKLCVHDPSLLWLMKSVLHSVRTPHRNVRLFYESVTQHLIVAILDSKDHAIASSPWARGSLSATALRRVKTYVEENLAEDLSLETLAGVANVSRFHFLRQFKVSMGCTPHRYLMQRRMNRARDLLLSSDLPIAEVALECGFVDPSHFALQFRRAFRHAPSEFRRMHASRVIV